MENRYRTAYRLRIRTVRFRHMALVRSYVVY